LTVSSVMSIVLIALVVLPQRNELRRTFITGTPQGYRWQRLGLTL
jgi:hypothetical protein